MKSLSNYIKESADDKFIAVITAVNQYAEGITGQNFYAYIYANTDKLGFSSKKDAEAAVKSDISKDRKMYTDKIVKKTEYGNIGRTYSKPKYLTMSEYNKLRHDDYVLRNASIEYK